MDSIETAKDFFVIHIPPQTSILLKEKNIEENFIIIDFTGLPKAFNSKNRLNFGKLSLDELKSFYNNDSNSFLIPVKILGNTKLSNYLFENFGDGFWSSETILEIKNIDNFNFPKIKDIEIKGGIAINENSYDFKNDEFNLGNTFDLSDSMNKMVSKSRIKNRKVEINLEDASSNSTYFISVLTSKYIDGNFNEFSESRSAFLKKINKEYISRTNTQKYNNVLRLNRLIESEEAYHEYLIFLTIFENNRYYFKLIGKGRNDLLGPEINNFNSFVVRKYAKEIPEGKEEIYVDAKTWRGLTHPYEIEIFGYIDRLYIGGNRININKNKKYQKIYQVLTIDVNLGYYRIPIIAYDKVGNRTESYVEGTATSGSD